MEVAVHTANTILTSIPWAVRFS